jgi:hypothetical protein
VDERHNDDERHDMELADTDPVRVGLLVRAAVSVRPGTRGVRPGCTQT